MNYILALDQGTTSSRSILFDRFGQMHGSSQQDFPQYFPQPGWVEHDPMEIWNSQLQTIQDLQKDQADAFEQVAAIGITNQRETTLIWNRETGEPIHNAIVWQDRRTADYCAQLHEEGYSQMIQDKTGLVLDAYFSATKVKWLLDQVPGARAQANNGKLCFGTVDSWLVWKLTGGRIHITDVSNASRTMLYNIHDLCWDKALLELMDIPAALLPEVLESSEVYGMTDASVVGFECPIAGIAGDQQAALFGQLCVDTGMVKNTYGTGCFLLMNTGATPVASKNNLLTTIAWKRNGKVTYALEGSVFVGGAAVQWLRDGLELFENAMDIEQMAQTVPDNGGVYFVPALTGLGAPHWDPYARGSIQGLTRGSTKGHIARAALEGIAFQVYDIVKAMEEDMGGAGTQLRVDGGAAANNLLMQIQADLFGFEVVRPKNLETTALGAAYLAGLAVGFWSDLEDLKKQWEVDRNFTPQLPPEQTKALLAQWNKAVARSQNWASE